jgi:hypothetical protein
MGAAGIKVNEGKTDFNFAYLKKRKFRRKVFIKPKFFSFDNSKS